MANTDVRIDSPLYRDRSKAIFNRMREAVEEFGSEGGVALVHATYARFLRSIGVKVNQLWIRVDGKDELVCVARSEPKPSPIVLLPQHLASELGQLQRKKGDA